MEDDIRITVLHRGWIVVGQYSQDGPRCFVKKGAVIRRWGSERGLGQIAKDGPTSQTILDPTPTVQAHETQVICTFECDSAKWKKHIK